MLWDRSLLLTPHIKGARQHGVCQYVCVHECVLYVSGL